MVYGILGGIRWVWRRWGFMVEMFIWVRFRCFCSSYTVYIELSMMVEVNMYVIYDQCSVPL